MTPTCQIIQGNVSDILPKIPDESVQCVVTSPPYWRLRDYQVDGQLGMEDTVEEYIDNLVGVFREIRRILREDGLLWINIGSSYAGSQRAGNNPEYHGKHRMFGKDGWKPEIFGRPGKIPTNLKPKDLVGEPWRLAFALQADGWWLRSDIIWAKGVSFCDSYSGSVMPSSVTDRPTTSHEYVFMLSKSRRYFYDQWAVREKYTCEKHRGPNNYAASREARGTGAGHTGLPRHIPNPNGRNLRSVWTINPKPFPLAHFATFPPALIYPIIRASTSEKGCCSVCGAPWERIVEQTGYPAQEEKIAEMAKHGVPRQTAGLRNFSGPEHARFKQENPDLTIGWKPTCTHDAETVPCDVLDPFGGSGTVGLVAMELGRSSILVELSPKYCDMAHKRIANAHPFFEPNIFIVR